MPFCRFCSLCVVLFALVGAPGRLQAHNVPSMTIETRFTEAGNFDLAINFDPRAFLATDPRSLPPVPASWYREQSPEQVAATQAKAREYLQNSLGLVFSGNPLRMPELTLQAIDGADNTPLKAETEELHLLAKCAAPIPEGATDFQITFAKTAAIDLILINTLENSPERRPQVLFPGETSRAFVFRAAPPQPQAPVPPARPVNLSTITLIVTSIAVFIGWALLNKYRHYHRGHRKPKDHS